LKFRKKNAIGKGIGYGALLGFGFGAIIGLTSAKDNNVWELSAGERAVVLGIPMMIPGAILGALIGSAKVKIPINGKMDHYEKQRIKINKYSLVE